MRWFFLFLGLLWIIWLSSGVATLERHADAQDARIGALYARVDSLGTGR